MSVATQQAIDCDVHCAPTSMEGLLPYLDDYWRDYIAGAGLRLSPTVGGAYPPGAATSATPQARESGSFPPHDVAALREQVLDRGNLRYAVLNCVTSFDTSRNLYYEAALSRAINDWLRAEWLDRDERLRASMVVPTLDPEAAAEEIDRVGSDGRFVQVLLPVRSDARYGNKRFRPIHEAAARHGLAIGLHAWGRVGSAPTPTGFTHSYLEDYLANSQLLVQAHVVSLVAEGVFDRFPSLRVALVECGFCWMPSLLWRFDKDWKAVWREVPWLKAKPSEYVHRHFRATTAPAQLPPNTDHLAQVAEMLGASDFLMYASDYPHDHGDDIHRLLDRLDVDGRRSVLDANAADFYALDR